MAQAYPPGTEVEYFSTSLSKWIPARVLRSGRAPGTFDLDCKDGVEAARIRLPGGYAAAAAAAGEGAGGAGPLGLREGEACFYRSSTRGWITAEVARFRPQEGTYDLDVKQQVTADSICPVRPGDVLEYHSTSSDSWIPTKVLRVGASAGTFDLDCKENVHISRLRPGKDRTASGVPAARRSGGYPGGLARLPEEGVLCEAVRQQKLEQLRQASLSGNPEALKRRLESTSALSLAGEEALDAAGHKLWALEARPEAQAELRRAVAGHSREALELALEAAVVAGVPASELESARQALKRLAAPQLWQYDAGDGHHVDVRAKPELNGPRVRKRLEAGDVFSVSEERRGADGVLYLRLADGRGWLFDRKPGVGVMCRRYIASEPDGLGSYVVIHDQAAVTPTEAIGDNEAIVGHLAAGTIVKVLQVVNKMGAQRIRGRIENPPGWISLLDTEGGIRWAVKHKSGERGRNM